MMTTPVAVIDPHKDSFTVGIVTANGVEIAHATFGNSAAGYVDAIEFLASQGVAQVGVEGPASWGAHVANALVAASFDAREVPPQRSSRKRQPRRLDKTDVVDSVAIARALLAEPTLEPVQAVEIYDPFVAKIEAVLEHRRMLVAVRTLALHHVRDELDKLPTDIRDQLDATGKVESRLRRLENLDIGEVSTLAGAYRLS